MLTLAQNVSGTIEECTDVDLLLHRLTILESCHRAKFALAFYFNGVVYIVPATMAMDVLTELSCPAIRLDEEHGD